MAYAVRRMEASTTLPEKARNQHRLLPTALALLFVSLSASANTQASDELLLGLPKIKTGDDTQTAATLGRKLFFDPRLSADGKISCGSCHQPNLAFTDGRSRSLGHADQSTTRNAPSLINAAYLRTLFWDGRAESLETQARAPLINPVEHGLADDTALERIIRQDATYVQQFRAAFGTEPGEISAHHVAQALAAYERTLRAGRSRFDRYQYAGEKPALSASAVRGLGLFVGRAQCVACHTIGANSALLTDESFHVTPVGIPRDVTVNLSALAQKVFNARDRGEKAELERLIATDANIAALGRFIVTQDPLDIGTFKTPTLRNVALTAPYMHDGSVKTLKEAVDLELYGRGAAVRYPIVLTLAEKADLIEFLRSLTSEPLPGVNHPTAQVNSQSD
jgi:cytochrome c peroxidase